MSRQLEEALHAKDADIRSANAAIEDRNVIIRRHELEVARLAELMKVKVVCSRAVLHHARASTSF